VAPEGAHEALAARRTRAPATAPARRAAGQGDGRRAAPRRTCRTARCCRRGLGSARRSVARHSPARAGARGRRRASVRSGRARRGAAPAHARPRALPLAGTPRRSAPPRACSRTTCSTGGPGRSRCRKRRSVAGPRRAIPRRGRPRCFAASSQARSPTADAARTPRPVRPERTSDRHLRGRWEVSVARSVVRDAARTPGRTSGAAGSYVRTSCTSFVFRMGQYGRRSVKRPRRPAHWDRFSSLDVKIGSRCSRTRSRPTSCAKPPARSAPLVSVNEESE
jgi:hypothetical protein